jgi:hypothetical protein
VSLVSKKISVSGTIFVIISILLVLLIGYLIYLTSFSPDAINRRNGVPESGWDGLVSGIVLIPTIIILIIVDIFAAITYFSNRKKQV